ncbi:DUF3500 domain-containing protein [Deinococcus hopiensis]|uniref:DUF3500 domain-containing protein n=1 Tax=Deinococcus hopiensis KR-140 TaxID=695939 RepID=A0A1W1UBI2_9DEIO|nr:DUF3500 domain-containing protein [Deinococcus hopiensis]SMB78413.1 Protein of unknown function [Deinococcus hopiensis KR-140]
MKLLSGFLAVALGGVSLYTHSVASAATTATPSTATVKAGVADAQSTKVVNAANAFLSTLTAAQKKAVLFAWTDQAQRTRWSNFPTGIFQRAGLRWGDLTAKQRTALMTLLSATLSPDGLKMVKEQMNADEVLKTTDTGGAPGGAAGARRTPPAGAPAGGPGGNSGPGGLIFGSDEYYVSFLGTPSTTSPWTLQFGGHHLAINATMVGTNITLSPSLTGGQPITATQNGKTVVVVEKVPQEAKDGFALLSSLNATQRSKAIISTQSIDLVLGPGQDGKTLQPEGLAGSAMTAAQKAQLLTLIKDRLGILNANDAASKLATIQKNLDQTYFAWYGPTTSGAAAYYRITGPSVLIEFSPQQMGGDSSNHLHNMYREPGNDYGAAWAK